MKNNLKSWLSVTLLIVIFIIILGIFTSARFLLPFISLVLLTGLVARYSVDWWKMRHSKKQAVKNHVLH